MKGPIPHAVVLHVIGTVVAIGLVATGFVLRPGTTNLVSPEREMAHGFFNAAGAMASILAAVGLLMLARSTKTDWLLIASTVICICLLLDWLLMGFSTL